MRRLLSIVSVLHSKCGASYSHLHKMYLLSFSHIYFPLVSGDIDPEEGISHAKSIANRISKSRECNPKKVYCAPFLRTVHTAHIIATSLSKPCVCVEEGLTEWQVPSLLVEPNGKRTHPKSAENHARTFASIDLSFQCLNPSIADDAVNTEGAPRFLEDEESLVFRCSTTLERLLEHAEGENIASKYDR